MSDQMNPVEIAEADLEQASEVYIDLQMLEKAIDTLMGVGSEVAIEANLTTKQAARIVADSVYVDPALKDLDSIRTSVINRKYKIENVLENQQNNLDGLKLKAYDRAIDMIQEELRLVNAVTRGDYGVAARADRLMRSSRRNTLKEIRDILTCNDQDD